MEAIKFILEEIAIQLQIMNRLAAGSSKTYNRVEEIVLEHRASTLNKED